MHQHEFQKILEKYRKGLCTAEEQALIEKWFEAMGSWDDPELGKSAKTEIRNRSRIRVLEHAHAKEKHDNRFTKQRKPAIMPRHVLAVAATVAIVAISLVFIVRSPRPDKDKSSSMQTHSRSITNDTEEEMEVLLNDGSRVLLKPESKLVYGESLQDDQRVVTLEGEAFFNVSRDTLHPFLVHTKEVITKVLGTSFTVSAFSDDENITVSVITGKVSVMTRKDPAQTSLQETILTPNQKITYNRNRNIVSRGIVNEPMPIHEAEVVNRLHFEAAPIKDIFAALEEVYGVDIEFDENTFSSCILTTSIAEGTIYNRLDMICKAIDAHYVLQENHIVISGAGCHR